MDRRGFIGFLLASPISRVMPSKWASRASLTAAPVSFQQIVAETLKQHRPQIAANAAAYNALLKSIKGIRNEP